MKSFCIAGIDPGSKGSVSFLWPSLCRIEVLDLPVDKVAGTSRTFTYVDADALTRMFEERNPLHTFLEKVHAMPSDGSVGAFTFGDNFGSIKGVLAALRCPRTQVPPETWKKALRVKADKKQAVLRAKELLPDCAAAFTRPDRAESALIALYGALDLRHSMTDRVRLLHQEAHDGSFQGAAPEG